MNDEKTPGAHSWFDNLVWCYGELRKTGMDVLLGGAALSLLLIVVWCLLSR
jgi:hypothetical protein